MRAIAAVAMLPLIKRLALITASVAGALMAPLAAGAGAVPRTDPLEPLTLTGAGVDAQRHPFARWTPTWPLVNILVSSRPVRRADGTPALRYWIQTGFMGSLPPVTSWRGDEPLIQLRMERRGHTRPRRSMKIWTDSRQGAAR